MDSEPFIILRRSPLGEVDDLVVGLGRGLGRFSAVVKGSRQGRGRLAGLLEPPVELDGQIIGDSRLSRLSGIVLRTAFTGINRRLEAMLTAGFLGRLVLECLPDHAPAPEVYDVLMEGLLALDAGRAVIPTALKAQDRLLAELGFEVMIDGCVECGAGDFSSFSAELGGVLCSACDDGSAIALDEEVFASLRDLRRCDLNLKDDPLDPRVVNSLGRVFKAQFQYHLDLPHHLFRRVLPKESYA